MSHECVFYNELSAVCRMTLKIAIRISFQEERTASDIGRRIIYHQVNALLVFSFFGVKKPVTRFIFEMTEVMLDTGIRAVV